LVYFGLLAACAVLRHNGLGQREGAQLEQSQAAQNPRENPFGRRKVNLYKNINNDNSLQRDEFATKTQFSRTFSIALSVVPHCLRLRARRRQIGRPIPSKT
jgi:hypothetical protein